MLGNMKKHLIFLVLLTSLVTNTSAQSTNDFTSFMFRNFKAPEELRDQCDWIYAIVKVNLDKQNKITSYECIHDYNNSYVPGFTFNKSLKFLVGYRIPGLAKNYKTLLFYFSIAHSETCTVKPSDGTPSPDDVVSTLSTYIVAAKQKNPEIEIYDKPITIFPFHQHK